ncbi:hypothetical protein TUM20985_33370 [Mycobacterium antarcticum]|uniref:hypothetical protein n=1 Tax=Mycolicibacterium sp. TUM20985 TaxID=3023370 RepID=UPI002573840B|nr:hypothetical protein [Mycolicibacterium sp. TUM20985]BDX32790.1 hypothetical protein TUM20985_33370 [Mycolicibacterium sp. TUM20985]
MPTPVQRAHRLYGARLGHLIVVLGSLALAGYTVAVLGVSQLVNPMVWWQSIAVWFAVAVIGHDLILFPLYALADRLLSRTPRPSVEHSEATGSVPGPVPLINYLRMPTLAAGLLLVMFLPGIIEQGGPAFTAATGLTQAPYLTRWILLTAAFYLISALCYGAKTLLRHHDSAPAAPVESAPAG